jgi:hypothetical protein
LPPPVAQNLEALTEISVYPARHHLLRLDELTRPCWRATFGPLFRSDAMWSERLHWEAATDLAPERVAERGREIFASAS